MNRVLTLFVLLIIITTKAEAYGNQSSVAAPGAVPAKSNRFKRFFRNFTSSFHHSYRQASARSNPYVGVPESEWDKIDAQRELDRAHADTDYWRLKPIGR
jgi:hypothetical protein